MSVWFGVDSEADEQAWQTGKWEADAMAADMAAAEWESDSYEEWIAQYGPVDDVCVVCDRRGPVGPDGACVRCEDDHADEVAAARVTYEVEPF